MKKNTIYTILGIGAAIIFLVVVIFVGSQKSGNANQLTSQSADISVKISDITAQEKFFDFGSISMAAGKVSHIFKIKNSGTQPVNIEKIFTSCMCTSATLIIGDKKTGPFGMAGHGFLPKVNKTLAIGEEAALEVVFDPAAHGPAGIGSIKRNIFMEDSFGGVLELEFFANVTP